MTFKLTPVFIFYTFLFSIIIITSSHYNLQAQNKPKLEDVQCQTVTEFINKLKQELPDAIWKVDRKRDDGTNMNNLKIDVSRNNVIWKVKNPKTGNERLANTYTIALQLEKVTNIETYQSTAPPPPTPVVAPKKIAPATIEKPNEYYSAWHFSEKSDSIRKVLEKKYNISNNMKNKGDNSYKANTLEQKNKLANLLIEHRLALDNLKNKGGNITYVPLPTHASTPPIQPNMPSKPVLYISTEGYYLKDGLTLYKVTNIDYPTEHISLEPNKIATEAETIYNRILQILTQK